MSAKTKERSKLVDRSNGFLRDTSVPPKHLKPFWKLYCDQPSQGPLPAPPGLTIAGQTIETLNGATSFRLFEPTDSFIKEMKSTSEFEPPVIILLGDEHFTREGQCDKCECGLEQECCYSTYDKRLLQLLDQFSTSKRPVQLYVEVFSRYIYNQLTQFAAADGKNLEQLTSHIQRKLLLKMKRINFQIPMLFANYFACYFRHAHPTARNRFCPTRRMQWHFSDPRVNSHRDGNDHSQTYDFEMKLSVVTEQVISLFPKMRINDQSVQRLKKMVNTYKYQLRFLKLFCETINKAASDGGSAEAFQPFVKGWIKIQDSMLAKRFNKLQNPSFEALFVLYLRYLCLTPMPRHKEVPNVAVADLPLIQSLPAILEALLSFQWSTFTSLCAAISDRDWGIGYYGLVNAQSSITDFYSYLRCLRSASQGTWLCVMVFGENHCDHLHHFFTDISNHYRCVAEVKASPDVDVPKAKCLSLKDIAVSLDQIAVAKGVWDEAKQVSCSQLSSYTSYESNMETLDGLRQRVLGKKLWQAWQMAEPLSEPVLDECLNDLNQYEMGMGPQDQFKPMAMTDFKQLILLRDHTMRVQVNHMIRNDILSEQDTQKIIKMFELMQRTSAPSTRPYAQELYNACYSGNVPVIDVLLHKYNVPVFPDHIEICIDFNRFEILQHLLSMPGVDEDTDIMNQVLTSLVPSDKINRLLKSLQPFLSTFHGSYDTDIYRATYKRMPEFRKLVNNGAYRHVFEPL